jgi:hypothetical protein
LPVFAVVAYDVPVQGPRLPIGDFVSPLGTARIQVPVVKIEGNLLQQLDVLAMAVMIDDKLAA